MSRPSGARLRVAFFGNFLSGSLGGRSVCEDVADRFEGRGAAVLRASPHRQPIRRLLHMLSTAARRRGDFDVAHIDVYSGRGFIWAESVALLLRGLGKPFVLTLRGGMLPEFGLANPRRMRRLLRAAQRVTAPSTFLVDAMREFRDDIMVLPNGVDVPAYRGRPREKPGPRFLWLRRFHAMYNPILAVRVLARVSQTHFDARLTMAGPDEGDGSLAATLAEAERLGVAFRVHVVGNVPKPDIPQLMASHDIFLNTTDVDNTPISLVEAMASGLCIVTTNVGGIPALCTDRETALFVPPRDADAMTAACLSILGEATLGRDLSGRALAWASRFDMDQILARWEALLWSASGRA